MALSATVYCWSLGQGNKNVSKRPLQGLCFWHLQKALSLHPRDGVFDVTKNYTSLLIMKCLREVEDEEIVKEACETTAINDIVDLRYGGRSS